MLAGELAYSHQKKNVLKFYNFVLDNVNHPQLTHHLPPFIKCFSPKHETVTVGLIVFYFSNLNACGEFKGSPFFLKNNIHSHICLNILNQNSDHAFEKITTQES